VEENEPEEFRNMVCFLLFFFFLLSRLTEVYFSLVPSTHTAILDKDLSALKKLFDLTGFDVNRGLKEDDFREVDL
jgi:hypothetical protein